MNFLATIKVALQALRVNKLRSMLTMLGIIIGVAAVITMVAVGAGAQARVEDQIRSLGSNLIIILSGNFTSGGVRLGSGSQLTITEDDAYALAREIPSIQVAAPTLRGNGQVVYGNTNWATQISGITPDYLEARQWEVAAAGRSTWRSSTARPRSCSWARPSPARSSATRIRSARPSASAASRTR